MDLNSLKYDIIEALDVESFYIDSTSSSSHQASLKYNPEGWSTKILCPLHGDSKTPNLSFNKETGQFKCFACNKSGSIFDFYCYLKGLSIDNEFVEALAHLGKLAGIEVQKWQSRQNSGNRDDENFTGVKNNKNSKTKKRVNKADAIDKTKSPITIEVVERFQKNLKPEHYKYLNQERGLTKKTIEDRKIGFDNTDKWKTSQDTWGMGRYIIPVYNREGECVNLRRYAPQSAAEYKMLNLKGRGSPPRLYGLSHLIKRNSSHIFLCEGEWDSILLNQEFEKNENENYIAITGTHGVNTFEEEWLEFLYDKHVYFVFDTDPPGKAAAIDICTRFFLQAYKNNRFQSLKILNLPLDGSKEFKDVTDFFIKYNGSIRDLITLADTTPNIEVGGIEGDDASIKPIEIDDLVVAVKDRRYIDKRVTVPITITGQTSKTYHSVRSYEVLNCPAKDDCCSKDAGERYIPYGHEIFIQSCMASRIVINSCIRSICCTAQQKCSIRVIKKVVMEEYFATQLIKRWLAVENSQGRMENQHDPITISIYVLQPKNPIEISPQNYKATGWIRSHPNTSLATFFVEHLEPLEDEWTEFELNDNEIDKLKSLAKFSTKEMFEQLTNEVTQIYESHEILLTVLLTYLSPLWINFNGNIIHGWINSVILGDSGTGKSATYSRVSDWLELGDLFSALTGTRTGLLYTVKQKASEWHVQIGRYVMASRKIIAVDETQEIPPEELKKMAIAMDSGRLDISQVASGGYSTQTRTLFLMNPPAGKTISDYSHGVEALADCFDPMFIRRLDIAIFVSSKEDISFYHKQREHQKYDKVLHAELFKTLIYWAWTRDINQIIWDGEAVKSCLENSEKLAARYGASDDIPLIHPGDFRNNLCRLSTAFAILRCSFSEDFIGVVVKPEHVEFICNFLDTVYSSMSCNLVQYSKNSAKKKVLNDYEKIKGNFENLIKYIRQSPSPRYANAFHFCQLLLLLQQIKYTRKRDLRDQLGVSSAWVQKYIAILQGYNLLELTRAGYKTTKKFNIFMQRWLKDNEDMNELFGEIESRIGEEAMKRDETSEYINYERENEDEEYEESSF